MKIINKSTLGFILMIVALSSLFTKTLFAWSTGPEAYRAGAPGDKETCNDSGCHNSYSLDSGSAKFSITGPASYTPGETIKLKVSFGSSSGKLHGFEFDKAFHRNAFQTGQQFRHARLRRQHVADAGDIFAGNFIAERLQGR